MSDLAKSGVNASGGARAKSWLKVGALLGGGEGFLALAVVREDDGEVHERVWPSWA